MKKRKLFIALALAGAFTFSLASCGGNSGVTVNSNTIPSTTSSGGEATNTGNPDPVNPVVEEGLKAYKLNNDLFAVIRKENKLARIIVIASELSFDLIPNYKDNKIVGLTVDNSYDLNNGFYFTLGDNFVNNSMNEYFFSLKNDELIIAKDDAKLTISFDGNSASTNMTEIAMDKEFEIEGYAMKLVNNTLQAEEGEELSVMEITESGIITYRKNIITNEIVYKDIVERKGNNEYYYRYQSQEESPLSLSDMTIKTYDSNNRLKSVSNYGVSEYGVYPNSAYNYFYDENGLLVYIKGENGSKSVGYKYDEYGRIIKEDYGSDGYVEYQYNDNGSLATEINISPYSSTPAGKYVYVYENNKLVKKNIYSYDFSTKLFDAEISAVYKSEINGNVITQTYDYKDGSKKIFTSDNSKDKVIVEQKRLDSNQKITSYFRNETYYTNGLVSKHCMYNQNNGQVYKANEDIYTYTDNYNAKETYNYNSDGNIQSADKTIYNIDSKGFVQSIYYYNYDKTKKEFIDCNSHIIINRDANNNITSTEEYTVEDKNVTTYEYTNGDISKISFVGSRLNESNEYVGYTASEKIFVNGKITEYKEYGYDNNQKLVSLHATYNEFFEKTTERYYYYSNGELTDSTYGYDYSYNENGTKKTFKYLRYNETSKAYETLEETNYEYNDNNLVAKEISHSDKYQMDVTLENTYNSNYQIESQIKTSKEKDNTPNIIKQVYDYDKVTRTRYHYENNEWVLDYTNNYIYYLDSSALPLS